MAITVGTPTTSVSTLAWDGSKFKATFSHTTVTGDNVLVVGAMGHSGNTPISVKFNGVALTLREQTSDGNLGKTYYYDMDSPDIGTHTVEIVAAGTYVYGLMAVALSGVDVGGTPRGTAVEAFGNSGTATVSATTAAGDLLLGICSTDNVGAASSTTSLVDDLSASDEFGQMGYNVATGASTSVSWTQTSGFWAVTAVPYKPTATTGLSITSVTPSSFDDGVSGIVIAGSGFGSATGTVAIAGVSQTVTAWADNSITVTSVLGTNKYGPALIKVTPA